MHSRRINNFVNCRRCFGLCIYLLLLRSAVQCAPCPAITKYIYNTWAEVSLFVTKQCAASSSLGAKIGGF